MSVVELDGDLVREFAPGTRRLLEATDNVIERGGDPKVLLLEAELLAALEVVVGVEDGADGLGALLLGDGALVISVVELLKVKLAAGSFAGPQAEVVGGRGGVAGDGYVVGDGRDSLAALPAGYELARVVGLLADVSVELDLMVCRS